MLCRVLSKWYLHNRRLVSHQLSLGLVPLSHAHTPHPTAKRKKRTYLVGQVLSREGFWGGNYTLISSVASLPTMCLMASGPPGCLVAQLSSFMA